MKLQALLISTLDGRDWST